MARRRVGLVVVEVDEQVGEPAADHCPGDDPQDDEQQVVPAAPGARPPGIDCRGLRPATRAVDDEGDEDRRRERQRLPANGLAGEAQVGIEAQLDDGGLHGRLSVPKGSRRRRRAR